MVVRKRKAEVVSVRNQLQGKADTEDIEAFRVKVQGADASIVGKTRMWAMEHFQRRPRIEADRREGAGVVSLTVCGEL